MSERRLIVEKKWITVSEAAEYAGKSEETVRVAMRSRELRGAQPKKNATWRTQAGWVDAWLEGRTLTRAA